MNGTAFQITGDANANLITVVPGVDANLAPVYRTFVDNVLADTRLQAGIDLIRIDGGDGSDSLHVNAGITVPAHIYGDDGDDVISNGSSGGILDGNAGDDEISGGSGNDTMYGGTGSDELYGNDGNDNIHGQDGADTAYGGDGDDGFYSLLDEDIDYVNGGDGDDTVWASYDNDEETPIVDEFVDIESGID